MSKRPNGRAEHALAEKRITFGFEFSRFLMAHAELANRIPRDAAVSVNGDRVQDDYVVRPGDEIEFQKQAGVKGLGA